MDHRNVSDTVGRLTASDKAFSWSDNGDFCYNQKISEVLTEVVTAWRTARIIFVRG